MGTIWIIGGIAAVAASFFLSGGDDVWQSLDAAGVATALYLMALLGFTTRKPFGTRTRVFVWCVFILAGTGVYLDWSGMSETAHRQKESLLKIRGTVSRSIMLNEMPAPLMKVLRSYAEQPPKKRGSLGKAFQAMYPADSVGRNIHTPFDQQDNLKIVVASVSDTEVVLIGQEMSVAGADRSKKNFDGRAGMVQARAILTERGVRYEPEN
ncbi:MAG: hypothetical protein E6K56_00290 [Ignavibacteria bacterium]|nr:MAG: hypothetical protein E6K56_00290 [Ignavibacteria bacterium]